MALRIRGKNKYYHAYFRAILSDGKGVLRYLNKTVNLHTTSLVEAKALEKELMEQNNAARMHQRFVANMTKLEIASGKRIQEEEPSVIHAKRIKRLRIPDAIDTASKYHNVGYTAKRRWLAFAKKIGVTYMDQVTPDMAFEYLTKLCRDGSSGKNFNNNKSALNSIFRLTLLDSGLKESPFERIPNRAVKAVHQRPFTEDEFIRIYNAAPEPWKTATLIAWFTGLREKDVFSLRWEQIDGDIMTVLPAKTARFGRAVRIPIHPQLMDALNSLPHYGERVLGAWEYNTRDKKFNRAFGKILKELNITDNTEGKVCFNSLRDSFVTRCDEAGIPRHAIRGIVGHVSDEQTDLYSHDLYSARKVQELPQVKITNQK